MLIGQQEVDTTVSKRSRHNSIVEVPVHVRDSRQFNVQNITDLFLQQENSITMNL